MKKIYLLLIFLPHILFADTSDNPPCLQTLICNVNGAFLKDNKDNRACIKELIITQTNNNEQESDVTPMCLSQATIDNNPRINYNLGRIDPIPRSIPPTDGYTPDVYIPDAGPPTIIIDNAGDTNGHCANYGICNDNNTNPVIEPPGEFVIMNPPRERKGDSTVNTGTGILRDLPTATQEQKPLPLAK